MTNDKQRERLVELIIKGNNQPCGNGYPWEDNYCKGCEYEGKKDCRVLQLADYLLANVVIVPPCKVGDTVYSIDNCINRPEMIVVTSIHHHKKHTFFSALSRSQREYCFEEKDIGKTVFFTKEEAEEALKGGVQG